MYSYAYKRRHCSSLRSPKFKIELHALITTPNRSVTVKNESDFGTGISQYDKHHLRLRNRLKNTKSRRIGISVTMQ